MEHGTSVFKDAYSSVDQGWIIRPGRPLDELDIAARRDQNAHVYPATAGGAQGGQDGRCRDEIRRSDIQAMTCPIDGGEVRVVDPGFGIWAAGHDGHVRSRRAGL